MIVDDLLESNLGASYITGCRDFLGQGGYLSERYSFYGDQLHLNYPGARKLASMIKHAIDFRKGNGLVSGVSYQAAVVGVG